MNRASHRSSLLLIHFVGVAYDAVVVVVVGSRRSKLASVHEGKLLPMDGALCVRYDEI